MAGGALPPTAVNDVRSFAAWQFSWATGNPGINDLRSRRCLPNRRECAPNDGFGGIKGHSAVQPKRRTRDSSNKNGYQAECSRACTGSAADDQK
jgi:hypothetical protein